MRYKEGDMIGGYRVGTWIDGVTGEPLPLDSDGYPIEPKGDDFVTVSVAGKRKPKPGKPKPGKPKPGC